MKSPVVVIGSFNQDLAFATKQFPRPGETVVGDFRTGPGGKGFNQAIAASRAGVGTQFIGAVGADAFGAEARRFAQAEKLSAHFIAKPKHPTGCASIVVNGDGQNEVIIALGANLALRPRDLPAKIFRRAEVVVCQAESDYATIAHVLRTARTLGAITVFNPAPMRAEFDVALLQHTSVLIPNETEFVALVHRVPACGALLGTKNLPASGEFTEASLRTLSHDLLHQLCRALGVPVVIVTLGSRGCFVSHPDGGQLIAAHAVDAIDTTGAGDAFVGGFAAGLVKFNHHVIEAAHYASAVAALSVTRAGTAPSMPREREIARFLRQRARK